MRSATQLLLCVLLLFVFFWATRGRLSGRPKICEELGYKLSPTLQSALYRPFQLAELDSAQREAGLSQATEQQQPLAIWLVGPSAAGKSYLARKGATDLGVRVLPSQSLDAVLLDGNAFRNWHGGYQAVIQEGHRLQCVWQEAYPAMRFRLQQQKTRLLHKAARQRLNIIIPHTCDYLSECAPLLYFLRRRGYVNHVIMVLGDRETIQQRGRIRAQATGKRYAPEEWDESVSNGFKMVALATGYAEFAWTTPRTKWLVKRGLPIDVFNAATSFGITAPGVARIRRSPLLENESMPKKFRVHLETGNREASDDVRYRL